MITILTMLTAIMKIMITMAIINSHTDPNKVESMINAIRIKLQNEQELDYEKLVSSTKLHGATEGTARVEVFHNCQQKHFHPLFKN